MYRFDQSDNGSLWTHFMQMGLFIFVGTQWCCTSYFSTGTQSSQSQCNCHADTSSSRFLPVGCIKMHETLASVYEACSSLNAPFNFTSLLPQSCYPRQNFKVGGKVLDWLSSSASFLWPTDRKQWLRTLRDCSEGRIDPPIAIDFLSDVPLRANRITVSSSLSPIAG